MPRGSAALGWAAVDAAWPLLQRQRQLRRIAEVARQPARLALVVATRAALAEQAAGIGRRDELRDALGR